MVFERQKQTESTHRPCYASGIGSGLYLDGERGLGVETSQPWRAHRSLSIRARVSGCEGCEGYMAWAALIFHPILFTLFSPFLQSNQFGLGCVVGTRGKGAARRISECPLEKRSPGRAAPGMGEGGGGRDGRRGGLKNAKRENGAI